MKNRIIRLLVETIIIISGIALVFGFPNNELLKSLAFGFITAGITSVLFEVILKDEFVDELKGYMYPPLKFIDIRENMDKVYRREFRSAKRIDVIASTSENLIRVCEDLIRHKLLTERCEIRIAYLNPNSKLWDYRLKIEPELSRQKLQEILKRAKESYESLAVSLLENPQIKGSLIVRAYDTIPYFAYFRADRKIILGFYYSYTAGMKSHAFIAEENKTNLFGKFEDHFDAVWRDHDSIEIVSIYNRDIHVGGKQVETSSNMESQAAPNDSFTPTVQ